MKWGELPWGKWLARGRQAAGRYKFVLLVFALGLLLLLLPGGGEEPAPAAGTETGTAFDLEETEAELAEALSRIEGAGEVSVVLTLRSGSRQILAQDTQTDQRESSIQTSQSTVVVSRGSGEEGPILLQEFCPTYQGALVVCPGGGEPSVQLELTRAVSALTGLTSDKISICKGK